MDNIGGYDDGVLTFIERALITILDDSKTVDELVQLVLDTGKYGVDDMALIR